MNTGGTPDVVVDEETGLLSSSFEELADDVRRLTEDETLRRRLGDGARRHVLERFDTSVVIRRVDRLYRDLLESRA
jgi:glycosyltransferase involved in cell wall biosynthesis